MSANSATDEKLMEFFLIFHVDHLPEENADKNIKLCLLPNTNTILSRLVLYYQKILLCNS